MTRHRKIDKGLPHRVYVKYDSYRLYAAKKYAALMRKIFVYVISQLGVRQDNPIDQLDMSDYEMHKRAVLATHDQIKAIRAAGFIGKDGRKTRTGDMFACIIDMTYLCWQRAIDVRTLQESQIKDGHILFKLTKTIKSSGKQVNIFITPNNQIVIDRAKEIKRNYSIISEYVFRKPNRKPFTKDSLGKTWDRAKERAGITSDVTFRDLRSLGATDAAKAGEDRKDIQKRLAHTSAKTTEIYIKEVIPEKSNLASKLPW